ncbi:MAG TPA: glutamate--cysteine ligase, partial [Rhodospirillaceae bacterium]|nr:glutamate--cysteine ligase [Rhodospirillaceae bacterium]
PLPAIWVGLLYDNDVLDQADRLVSDWTAEERDSLRKLTPTHGLNTPFRDGTLRDLGKTVLDLAREGLKRRAELDWVGVDERGFLNPLFETVETGITPAAEKRKRFETEWNGAIEPLYREYAY